MSTTKAAEGARVMTGADILGFPHPPCRRFGAPGEDESVPGGDPLDPGEVRPGPVLRRIGADQPLCHLGEVDLNRAV